MRREREQLRNADGAFKRVFSFLDDDRALLRDAKVGSRADITVCDEQGEPVEMQFFVTRNVRLGKKTQWIYGRVFNTPEGNYYQIELKLREHPLKDTVEVFLQAPPATFNELR